MPHMKRILYIVLFLMGANLVLVGKTFAATCTPIYNGGPTCTNTGLSVQKEVLNPQTNLFVHDLGLSDAHYHGNDMATFQITLTNNSNQDMTNITVQDNLPQDVTFHDGTGTYNAGNKTFTFQVKNLVAKHSQVFTINTTVNNQNSFTNSNPVFCETNNVVAVPSNGQIAQDSAQFCIEKLTGTPSTGPEAFGLLGLISLLPLGYKLRKSA